MSTFRCACGHDLSRELSKVDGRVLWFHNSPGCTCRLAPGCGAPPPPFTPVGAVVNGHPRPPLSTLVEP